MLNQKGVARKLFNVTEKRITLSAVKQLVPHEFSQRLGQTIKTLVQLVDITRAPVISTHLYRLEDYGLVIFLAII